MRDVPPRRARLVLVDRDGRVLGALPPLDVETPWWPEAGPVIRAAREQHGVEVVILRLLEAERTIPAGGEVTYVAEVLRLPEPPRALEPWDRPLEDHPLRLPWARPGGPAADLAWADEALTRAGLRRTAAPSQVRSWNLSTLWRIPVDGAERETVWLKHVPPFFAHEGPILERLAGGNVPRLVAQDGARILIHEIPGQDLYGAERDILERLVDLLVGVQREWIGRIDELRALGLPDWRAPAVTEVIASVVERTASELTDEDRLTLDRFVTDLPRRFEAIAEAGVPDTLVHGDFHAGNARGDESTLTLLDWGDSGVGHPLLDEAAYLDRMDPASVEPVREHWHRRWREAVPGADPARASALLSPVAAARQAHIYRKFLDGIEPSEHPYHATDPAEWLRRTAALVRAEA